MADKNSKMSGPATTAERPADAAIPAGGAVVAAGNGGDVVPSTNGGGVFRPAGGIALDVGTDVTDRLDAALPAFGNVLAAIGNGVAASQTALDHGVIDTVNELNGTNITVLTDVVEVLNGDGLPDAAQTQLITQDLSVLNFFAPVFHEWKNVSIAMDLSVGAFHESQGLTFSSSQHSSSFDTVGLFWGFLGWTTVDSEDRDVDVSSTRDHEVRWQSGQVRVDAMLGPRNTSKFPIPNKISIGPQIFITQGAVNDGTAGTRTVDIDIEVRKSDGTANPSKPIVLDAGGLLPSFTGPTGSATDPAGKVKATLTRNLTPGFTGFRKFPVSVSLGQIRKSFNVTL